ncbi:MASE1 domain-containing protein [Bordetella hinzii]|uniref:MASE1 domain-containing protein n=1 Tax=Bordetella hinzii TaxID=103855 RepID=UPI0009B8B9E8|nr:MASE1 domain-containing protein [Bordetella hinzii]QDJ50007.1 hypothetical protein CBR69_06580 [Bordetella hinzii]
MNETRLLRMMLFAAVYGVLAFYGLAQLDHGEYSSLLWPAAGILLGTLMVSRLRDWPLLIVVAAVLHAAAGIYSDRSAGISAVYVLTDVIVLPLGALLWRRRGKPGPHGLDTGRGLAWFLVSLAVIGVAGALLCTLGLALLHPGAPSTWQAWMTAEVIGGLVGAPLVVAWSGFRAKRSGGSNTRNFLSGALWFALLLASATIAFDGPTAVAVLGSTRYELSYLPLLFVVCVALTWDQRGATLATLALALIAAVQTSQGEGPFGSMFAFQRTGLLEVQGYVGAAAILSLLMSTLMADNRRVVEEARESRVRFEAALLGSRHVMYVYDPASGRIAWEGEVASVLGRPSTGMGSLEGLLSCVHPEDREALRAGLALRASGEADAEGALIYRLGLGRDEWLTVADTGSAIADTSDTVYLVTGLLRRYVERGL